MKSILKLLLLLLFVTGCKTKHLQIERKEDRHKETRQVKKDSVFEQVAESRNQFFLRENEIISQFELETADSIGGKELTFERIRSPAGEKIIVRGGRVKIKTSANFSEKITRKDTLQVNNTSVRTNIQENKTSESKSFKKEKEVKTQGFTFGGYLSLILWILVLVSLIFLAWRLKLFRQFKPFLNIIQKLFKGGTV